MFSIELLELRKPSVINWNRDTLTLLFGVLAVGMLAVEMYRRYKKANEDVKEQKKTERRKGNKKRR